MLCEITVDSIDELFESTVAQRYCFDTMCNASVPNRLFEFKTAELREESCINSPRNFAKCGQVPLNTLSSYKQEVIYFKNSRLVADLAGEMVYLGSVRKNIIDFFAKDYDESTGEASTLFYFIDEAQNIQKAVIEHNAGIHDHLMMSRGSDLNFNFLKSMSQKSSLYPYIGSLYIL